MKVTIILNQTELGFNTSNNAVSFFNRMGGSWGSQPVALKYSHIMNISFVRYVSIYINIYLGGLEMILMVSQGEHCFIL